MAYDKKNDGFWVHSDGDKAVHVGHVGKKPYILFNGEPVSFTVGDTLLIATQLIQHAIAAKLRKY